MICDKKKCTGCGLCEFICPKNAITLLKDEEGFLYPSIDKNKCINCKLCEKKCPALTFEVKNEYPKFFYAWSKDTNIVKTSSSGGLFTEFSKAILNMNGKVCGCVLKDKLAVHVIVNNIQELEELKGSKYVQSDIRNIFYEVKQSLKNKVPVLFCGTPCQVAAIKSLATLEEINFLYTIDLVCHGVSPISFFQKHIKEIEKKYHSEVKKVIFRNNSKEWRKYVIEYQLDSGKKIEKIAIEDHYMACYLNRAIYRESCYNCKYAKIPRVGDITLGDFSGIDESIVPRYAIKNGISACLINNNKGECLFDMIKDNLHFENGNLENLIKTNENVSKSAKRPEARNYILKDKNSTVENLQNKYCYYAITSKLINRVLPIKIQNKLRKMKELL